MRRTERRPAALPARRADEACWRRNTRRRRNDAGGARGPRCSVDFGITTLVALVDRDVRAQTVPGVDLARAADARVGILAHLQPVRDPAGQAPEREHDR